MIFQNRLTDLESWVDNFNAIYTEQGSCSYNNADRLIKES